MFSNLDEFGGKFLSVVEKELADAKGVRIASGYTSFDILHMFKDDLSRISQNNGSVQLLLGMAFYEGLAQNKLTLLEDLSRQLSTSKPDNGVYVSYSQRYHGKVYAFDKGDRVNVYVGSSNFSRSGLSENIEATVPITSEDDREQLERFLTYLFNNDNSVNILEADIVVPGSGKYKQRVALETLDDLEKYDPTTITTAGLQHIDISLARIAAKEKSNLNIYFGKGRWSRSTGKVIPRPWYEAEIIVPKEVSSSELYPKGQFTAYTDDGYIIPMATQGDYHKNLRSLRSLQILGMWIKGKLQKAGALIPLTPVTEESLDLYGNDTLRLYKLSEGKYFIKF
jgi:hypothetical protein